MHIYEVMAEPIRRRIVEVLASGEHYVGDLELLIRLEFGVGRAAVQHHLKVLREHQFVRTRIDWPYRSYRLDDDFVHTLGREAKRLKRRWAARTGSGIRTDPLAKPSLPSRRGYRGHGADPDDPWRHPAGPSVG
jgi:DNA-binding transcriptional ArsR family regulator